MDMFHKVDDLLDGTSDYLRMSTARSSLPHPSVHTVFIIAILCAFFFSHQVSTSCMANQFKTPMALIRFPFRSRCTPSYFDA